jgi:hypothetical protein
MDQGTGGQSQRCLRRTQKQEESEHKSQKREEEIDSDAKDQLGHQE